MAEIFDVAIIGGGINGCGCAADAALRGLSVFLCEQDDLASKTSSSSTKLIHGGLRYLEYYDFSLVKKALDERQIIMDSAPYLVYPLAMVLPYVKKTRSAWMVRIGLFIYDHLSRKNKLPKAHSIKRTRYPSFFLPLLKYFQKGVLFYDCSADDARLTITNALQAQEHGATIRTRTKLTHAEVHNGQWLLTLKPEKAEAYKIYAKSIINAAGPWVESINNLLNIPMKQPMALVKGSHLVVPKLYKGEHAYILQHSDGRLVFVIPYHDHTMIGTTDVDFEEDLQCVTISENEIEYLLKLVNQFFIHKLQKNQVLHSWSGVRPLLANPRKSATSLSRDYSYDYTSKPAPAVIIYGGKITTYRKLSLKVINQLNTIFPGLPASSTQAIPLPGAMIDHQSFSDYQIIAREKYHWLHTKTLIRYLQTYGTRTEKILQHCNQMSDLGICFMDTLYQVEVNYLINEEWAQTVDDILWRRTKLGLTADNMGRLQLQAYLDKIIANNCV